MIKCQTAFMLSYQDQSWEEFNYGSFILTEIKVVLCNLIINFQRWHYLLFSEAVECMSVWLGDMCSKLYHNIFRLYLEKRYISIFLNLLKRTSLMPKLRDRIEHHNFFLTKFPLWCDSIVGMTIDTHKIINPIQFWINNHYKRQYND